MEYYSLGIDPGWKNLGYAIVRKSIKEGISLVKAGTLNPSAGETSAIDILTGQPYDFRYITLERYVSYQGINSAESENILMFLGGLKYLLMREYHVLEDRGTLELTRAIDWKTELVKNLVRVKGFDNPSSSLDKKFSIAAANACLDQPGEFKNDHEADAICLACRPIYRKLAAEKQAAAANSSGDSSKGSDSP